MLKLVSAIYLFIIICSNTESGYDITKTVNNSVSNQLVFDLYPDDNLDLDLDHLIPKTAYNNKLLQLTYIAKQLSKEDAPLVKNKYQYLRPRAPPLT
ncbi:hypothetical protein L3081_21985 [Colwellia sp. MSW7]|uniref:Uncharacterized protein n=1 Tax=Colwellia maritima TaxID=2912588 RepID=A0ABS9X927_9GAMM|nr:hypothetical protein [Colwellia maritima]MCI2285572.1 hypothetical protein [Colwellia maritima]